jgi:transcriptional regulator with XRE-family HTH domain
MLRIKHLRLLAEKSQREVATRTNIPQAHLCYFESGRMTPRPEELVRLGKFFKCPPERLLDHVAPTGLPDGAESRADRRERSFVDRPAAATEQA